ncbi:MAG: shikimate dehydrogenase [Gemmatimonadota bacterium]
MRQSGTAPRMIALLGDPVAHSLSPRMHNAGFRSMGLDALYVATRCGIEDLGREMRTIAASGGGGNITVPHKLAATAFGRGDARVERLGIANVFVGTDDGSVSLGNSDVDGVLALLDGLGTAPSRWAILGTGGSARAVAAAALERGAAVASVSRSPERAATFEQWCRQIGCLITERTECELLVNATPIGLHADDPPIVDLAEWPGLTAVLDLPYRHPGTTPLIAAARARGLEAGDGLKMLLVQGVASWAWWFPGLEPPVEVMRDALRSPST